MRPIRSDWEKELRHFPLNPQGVPAKLKQSVEERIALEATHRRGKGKAWVAAAVLLLVSAVLFVQREPILSFFRQEVDSDPFDVKTERSLKVQWYDGMSFMSRYGSAFIIQYPNMDIETVNSPPYDPQKDRIAQYEDMIARDKPDLVYLPVDIYRELAAKGTLLSLKPLIDKDKYALSGFNDGIVDSIRAMGGGTLYGLAPNFSANALYYNKTIFDRFGVPYPTDKMSWDELFRLAQRIPADGEGDNRVYGLSLYMASPFGAADAASRTLGLGLTNEDGSKMTVHTESWRSIWQFVTDGVRKGWLYEEKPRTGSISGIDFYKRNPFMTGNAAMMVTNSSMASELIEAKKRYNLAEFAWDIATEPVNPANPDVSASISFDGIYAIPAQAAHARDAWELIKLIHSESMTKKVALQMAGIGLSTRKTTAKSTNSYRIEAFTMLRPDTEAAARANPIYTNELYNAMSAAVTEEIKAAASGAKSLDQAIEAIQQRGQWVLDQKKAAAKP
ncbi:extracellular solute-binding protein [Paenibacillus hodogayensis]|uniref:Extracellular solute-binding protein n=1 Tax=Paenibacillus hodogayensis TaxID=279208 RepID=A0ABV5VTA6_9BACL